MWRIYCKPLKMLLALFALLLGQFLVKPLQVSAASNFVFDQNTVLDQNTNLMWTRDAKSPGPPACNPGNKVDPEGYGHVYCLNTNNYLGYSDWVVPDLNQLGNMAAYGGSSTLNSLGFYNVMADLYFSSTVTDPMAGFGVWMIDMANNNLIPSFVVFTGGYVWPVRNATLPSNKLTLSINGVGNGDITADSGTLIWTGNIAEASYSPGTTVTLTPIPDSGSYFSGWTGCDSQLFDTCTVNMTTIKNVTATFDTRNYADVRLGSTFGNRQCIGSQSCEEASMNTSKFGSFNYDNEYASIKEIEYINSSSYLTMSTHALYPVEYFTQDGAIVQKTVPLANDTRKPLILIHGWQGDDTIHQDQNELNKKDYNAEAYWKNFIQYYEKSGMNAQYRLYVYHYPSYKHVTFNARVLAKLLQEDAYIKNHIDGGGQISIIAHSMGGLVARSLIEEQFNGSDDIHKYRIMHSDGTVLSKTGTDILQKLVTLATPHHGSPGAAYWWSMSTPVVDFSSTGWLIKDLFTPGSQDLFWDNYDRVFDPLFANAPVMWGIGGWLLPTNFDLNNSGRISQNSDFDKHYRDFLCLPGTCQSYFLPSPMGMMGVYRYPNPWLYRMNESLKNNMAAYANKYVFLSGYNENWNSSPNNLLSDAGFNGAADDMVKHQGYINDWAVPTTSGTFDFSLSSSQPSFVSKFSTQDISLFPDFTSGQELQVIHYGNVTDIPTALFKDYNHDRMLNGAYDKTPGDLLRYSNYECPSVGVGGGVNNCGGYTSTKIAKLYHDQSGVDDSAFSLAIFASDPASYDNAKLLYEPLYNVIQKSLNSLAFHNVGVTIGSNGNVVPGNQIILDGAKAVYGITPNTCYQTNIAGTCPQGSLSGDTYTTAAITQDCTIHITFSPSSLACNFILGLFQGPISGATVFADNLSGAGKRYSLDAGEISTTTDANGKFSLPSTPTYPYLLVSQGGVDTLTGLKAIQLLAPPGASNISSLTTLVALDGSGTLRTKIESLLGGRSYDTDISQTTTKAALMVAKTIETAISAYTNSIVTSVGSDKISNDQQAAIQTHIAQKIADEFGKPANTIGTLAAPVSLNTVVASALTAAITRTDYDGLHIAMPGTAPDTIALNSLDASAKAVGSNASDTDAVDSVTIVPENSMITDTTKYLFDTALTTSVQTIANNIQIIGTCGSSNGIAFTSAPKNNLCTTGIPSDIIGTGPWGWTCLGLNGGTTSTCNANFKETCTVTISVSGSGSGSINSMPSGISCSSGVEATCSGSFPSNSMVNLYALPNWKSIFTGWNIIGCSGLEVCNLSLSADTSVTANFTKNNQVKLSTAATSHASVQDAYNAANDGETFLIQVYSFPENLDFNRPINVKLIGGNDSSYSNTVGVTTIQGALIIKQGSVGIRNLVIQGKSL